jgi:prepilin-type N-terminal cleavage/methylation domain-containing protein
MLSSLKKSNNKGFTIIEIMIVLAIVAFIMLTLFLAVPALTRSKNNTARKSDAASLAGAITEYINNNSGSVPTAANWSNVTALWKPSFYTATSTTYTPAGGTATAVLDPASADKVNVAAFSTCSGNAGSTTNATARSIAISYDVETTGGLTQQCISAQ